MPQPDTNSNGGGLPAILLAVALMTVLAAFVAVAVSFFSEGLAVTYTAVVLSVGALALLAAAHLAARRSERGDPNGLQDDVGRTSPSPL